MKITLHHQNNGDIVQVTKYGPFEAARNGLRLTNKMHFLDDGTAVPMYRTEEGHEVWMAVTLPPGRTTPILPEEVKKWSAANAVG